MLAAKCRDESKITGADKCGNNSFFNLIKINILSHLILFKVKKRHFWLGILLMIILCTGTYSNHFHNEFHFDDAHTVQNNIYIRNIHNIPLFFKDGSTISSYPPNQAYRPVVVTSLAFDYWLGHGYNLFYFHLTTFILFLLQGLLMVWFFIRVFSISLPDSTRNTYIALISVTWYLLHPAVAETVNYVIARADLQSTLGVVGGFVLYQYSARSRKYYLYLLPVIIGALAKPPAIMFAPLLFVYILFFETELSLYDAFKKERFKQVFAVIKKTLPAFICCLIMYWLQAKLTPKNWEPGGSSPLQYLITQPFVILHYFQMFFVPNALSADTDWHLLPDILNWRFFTGMLFILVMIMIAFVTSQKKQLRPISFGIIWFFITLIPTSSIIPLGEVLNDHRMFFPFVGLCISLGWSISLLAKKVTPWFSKNVPGYKAAFIFVLCFALASYAYATYQRNKVWHTDEGLWYDVTIKSPDNGRGMMNYALTKMAQGDYATAAIYYNKALKLLPYYPSLYINIAILKAATGHDAEAEENFKKSLYYGGTSPDPYLYYGRYLNQKGRYTDAAANLQKAIAIAPANLYARIILMDVYQNLGNWNDLKSLATTTLQMSPDNIEAKNYLNAAIERKNKLDLTADLVKQAPSAEKYLDLSLQYYNAGQFEKCIEACKEAIKLKRDFPEAYNNMGSAYNMLGQYTQAINALNHALALKPNFQLAANNLAQAKARITDTPVQPENKQAQTKTAQDYINSSLAYFNSGNYQKCIEESYKALAIKPDYDLAYNNICAAYNKLGQWDKAIAAGKKGLALNPNNQLMKNNLQEANSHKNDK
ncbi:hypothetical protein GCM10028826_30690 [Mucilaginibacter boryungensis]